jgi:hypothetical protein
MLCINNDKIKIAVSSLFSGLIISSIYLVDTFQHPLAAIDSIKPAPF